MLLGEVLEQLFYGELSQTAIGKGSALSATHYPKLINHINLGILALYKRFTLLQKEVIIQLYDHITDYYLDYDYAETNTASIETYKYIMDTEYDPFNQTKILKIRGVFTELGVEYTLNPVYVDPNFDTYSALIAYTPSQTTLQIPYPCNDNAIAVICQAAPINIPTNTTVLTTKVNLPEVLLDPLLAFVAERYFIVMAADNKENVIYPSKFEKLCKQIDTNDLVTVDTISGSNRFRRGQWV